MNEIRELTEMEVEAVSGGGLFDITAPVVTVHARAGDARRRQRPQGLHEAVQGCLGAFAADEANLTEFLNAKRKRR